MKKNSRKPKKNKMHLPLKYGFCDHFVLVIFSLCTHLKIKDIGIVYYKYDKDTQITNKYCILKSNLDSKTLFLKAEEAAKELKGVHGNRGSLKGTLIGPVTQNRRKRETYFLSTIVKFSKKQNKKLALGTEVD